MWNYSKMLQYPINIRQRNPKLARWIISQYGGPDGEINASLNYLSQRFAMPDQRTKAVLNDIGTEELSHLEMVGTIVHQLTRDATIEEINNAGLQAYYTDHGIDVYPQSAGGLPQTSISVSAKGDPIANLQKDMAAEQKARATYEKLINLSKDDKEVMDVLRYLRAREVVHFQRFGEALRNVQDLLMEKRCYSMSNNASNSNTNGTNTNLVSSPTTNS